MKLFSRYNRVNLLAAIAVFLLSGVAYYFVIRYVLIDQLDDDLKIEQREVQTYASKYDKLPEIMNVRDQVIYYKPISNPLPRACFATRRNVQGIPEHESSRILLFSVAAGHQWYQVMVAKSLEGTEDLMQLIFTITFITIVLMLTISLLVNRLVLARLWRPFYETLKSINQFQLGASGSLQFPVTNIDEFTEMNKTLKNAIGKAEQDYKHLKEFTENASHELQTPLAIIQSKLEVLIQDESLSEANTRTVHSAFQALQRLSRLNKELLLLAKIGNGQYHQTEQIDLSKRINDKLAQFQEMLASSGLVIIKNVPPNIVFELNPMLADILLNNLLSNAFKYTPGGGTIKIELTASSLSIANTGTTALDEKRLFRRFANQGLPGEGIGLGLAIVQQAAAFSGFDARYQFVDGLHQFSLVKD